MTGKQIYFLRPVGQIGPIKIGCSRLPQDRLEYLAIQSPVRLEMIVSVPGTHTDERRLHGMFATSWLHHEWFAASKELLALVEYVVTHGALPQLPEGKVVPLPRKRRPATGRKQEPSGPSRRTVQAGLAARAEYEAGATVADLAAKHGLCILTMRKGLIAAGATIRRYTSACKQGVADPARANEFRRRYLAGDTLDAISRDFGVSRERVRQVLRKIGVPSLGWRSGPRLKKAA